MIPLNGAHITVIPHLFELSYFQNTGMSFGLLEGQQLLFMVFTVLARYYLILIKTKKFIVFLLRFLLGTLGNAIDRSIYGYVIDFMHFPFLDGFLNLIGLSNFYNNLADMS